MFWAISVFGFVSLMSLFGILIPLTYVGANRRIIVLIFLLGLAAIGGIAFLLTQQLSRLITMVERGERPPRQMTPPVEQNYQQIASPPRSMPGVTEHTTRNFDHSAYNETRGRE
jgi:hypothetical protein